MFDVTIQQYVLMKALEYLEPTVGKNNTGLGDNCISMKTTGNNSIEMYTTNTLEFTKLEAITTSVNTSIDQAPYVDFKRFKGIISSIPGNEIVTLKANVNDLLISFSLKKPIKLVGCNNGMICLPTNQFASSDTITIPTGIIQQGVNNVCNIIIDNLSAPIYNCMRIETNKMNIEMSALDMTNKRTFVQSVTGYNNNPQKEILIEASKLKKSLKIFEDYDDLELNMDNTVVRIDGTSQIPAYRQKANGMIENISYYARRLTGAFPNNIKAHLNPLPTKFCEINKEELKNCFIRIKAIEDQNNGGIVGFEANNNNLTVTLNSAFGNIEDTITMENSISSSFKTMFKYNSLNDIMKVIDNDTFEIGALPNHPTNYVVKSKGSNDVMFTIPTMLGASSTP